jgi:YidC/Oxa1 family membrane protein insertase
MQDRKRFLPLAIAIGLALALPYMFEKPADKAKPPAAASAKTPAKTEGKPPAAAAPLPQPASDPAARAAAERFGTIETETYSARLTNLGGGLVEFGLKGEHFQVEGKPVQMVTTSLPQYRPLALAFTGLPPEANDAIWQLQQLSPRAVQLSGDVGGMHVTRKVEAGEGPYQIWLTTHIENRGTAQRKVGLALSTFHYVTREAEGSKVPLLPVRSSATSHGLCLHSDDLERLDREKLLAPHTFGGPLAFAAVENHYFMSAIAPDSGTVERCVLQSEHRGMDEDHKPIGTLFSSRVEYKQLSLAPGASSTYRTLAYLGPKSPDELASAGHELKRAIEGGWFASIAEWLTWLLRRINDLVGNWGIAIILLTFVVKLVLFPVTARQMQSMAKMKELKPEIDRINALYGDDREKKGAAVMELYRKRGVNPMAGCFPMLLQLPIWFSLYASLSSNVQLFHAPFALWWQDLSSPDPYFVLPLALGILMFVQQKMSPATGMDPVQQKVMLYMMPAMITSFMLFLPAGLGLYMFTNSALSIVQQRVIESRLQQAGQTPPAEAPEKPESEGQDPEISTISPSRAQQRSGRPNKAERRFRRGKR